MRTLNSLWLNWVNRVLQLKANNQFIQNNKRASLTGRGGGERGKLKAISFGLLIWLRVSVSRWRLWLLLDPVVNRLLMIKSIRWQREGNVWPFLSVPEQWPCGCVWREGVGISWWGVREKLVILVKKLVILLTPRALVRRVECRYQLFCCWNSSALGSTRVA